MPRRTPHLQGAHQKAGGGNGQGMCQIVLDIRVVKVQCPCRRVVAIALFRNRQADNLDLRVGHRRQHRRWIFRRDQNII